MTPFEAAQGASHNARVADDATSAAQPARNAGQISLTLSSVQPGSVRHATGAYFAGSEGDEGRAGNEGGAGGLVAQPATISSAALAQASCVMRERREPDKMVWFFLEALVALLIAVAIVAWTMGLGRRKPPRITPGDADRDENP